MTAAIEAEFEAGVLPPDASLNTDELIRLNDAAILNTYGRRSIALVRGEGLRLWDADGKEYLDFFAGIAVTNLGHCHPAVTKAICDQAKTLVHVSNLYYIEPQIRLATLLSEKTFAHRWFFCNGGAEANEAAIKLARRYWVQKGSPKPTIVTANHSFHGRTLATVTATGQPKYHEGFEPLPPGFKYVPYDDPVALESAMSKDVGAVMLEPIQGEGGVRTPQPGYLKAVRELCDRKGALLILDEVQTGLGRTGTLFAHEQEGIAPDIMTIAKGLANGVPMGALGCTEEASTGFSVGSHACTFGGNPLSSAAALATLTTLTESDLIAKAADVGVYFVSCLNELAKKHSVVEEVRGKGLMIGVELKTSVGPVVNAMIENGVICGPAGPTVLRFLPPLVVEKHHVDHVVAVLDQVLGELEE